MANLNAIRLGLELDPKEDTFVSWLPLHHDMGLVGPLASSMIWGTELVLADPSTFIAEPSSWLKWCAQYNGTITVAPNFAYSLADRLLRSGKDTLDLSSLKAVMNGAEPIDVGFFESFLRSAETHRLSPSAAMCVYGLAEATLAVSFPRLGSGLQIDSPSGKEPLSSQNDVRGLAMLGSAVDGVEVRVTSSISTGYTDRDVGEIKIRGASITPGYLGESHQRSDGDWLATGDLGYIHSGQLVVCGRSKEMIIYGGTNIFPEHIEAAISLVPGVRHGSVLAFGISGRTGEKIVAIVEATSTDYQRIKSDIARSVLNHCDVALASIVVVQRGSLPKTTSGKVARGLAKSQFQSGELR